MPADLKPGVARQDHLHNARTFFRGATSPAIQQPLHGNGETKRSPLPTSPARANLRAVVQVQLTRHLFAYFPQLDGQLLEVEATDVAGVVRALEARAPGIGFYLCDERGRLRPHVNVFIGNTLIRDRRNLSDTVSAGDKVSILQALSGG